LDFQKLNQFTRAPDYIAYLAYILASLPHEEDRVRSIAGYLLKNNSRLIMQTSYPVAEFTKASVLQAFTDTSVMIRNAAGQAIVALLGTLEPTNWPQCLEQLFGLLDDRDADKQEVSDLFPHPIFFRAKFYECGLLHADFRSSPFIVSSSLGDDLLIPSIGSF
jgi:hypothetical protein